MALLRTILVSFLILSGLFSSSALAIEFSFHNPLVDAADAGQVNEVRALLKARHPVDGRGDFNTTALMRAAYRGNVEIAQMLINSGANIGMTDRGGATALHIAARSGNEAIAKMLIKYGAQLEVRDNEGWTPLMRSVLSRKPKITTLLVDSGADIFAENEAGNTPILQAAAAGSLEVLSALMQSPNFKNVTLADKEEAISIARKRKHRNIETVFSALLHPPARPSSSPAYPETAYASPDAIQKQPLHAPSQDEYAQGQYEVKVPDNGFESAEQAAAAPYQTPRSQIPVQHMGTHAAPMPLARPTGSAQAQPVSYGQQAPMPSYAPQPRYLLQLGAFANEDQAFYVWSNLKHRHPDVLGELQPDVLKAFLAYDQSEVFRLRAEGFTQREQAEATCRIMRERSIECFVIEQSSGGETPQPQAPIRQQQPPAQQVVQQQVPQMPYGTSAQQPVQPYQMAQAPQMQAQQGSPYPVYQAQQPQQVPYGQAARSPYPPQVAQSPIAASTGSPYQQPYGGDAGAPINPMQVQRQQAQPYGQPQAYAYDNGANVQPATHEDVREMARKQFYRSQGIQPPANQNQQGDFYRDIQQLEEQRNRFGGVSEAVRVSGGMPPQAGYGQMQQANQMRGIWVHVGDFPNEQYAQDYYQRMFKYDRSFAHLRMVSMKENLPFAGSMTVSMRLGPTGSEAEAYEVCRIAQQGGLNCNIMSDNRTSGYTQFETLGLQAGQGIRQDTLDPFWLTLGTFKEMSDAEYYWMYLLEDHLDVLGALKYDLAQRANNSREPFHLKAGPFLVQHQANRICGVLKYRNVACVVTH